MSPKTLSAMPKSPVGRRSSSGSGLRPVLPFGLDDGTALAEDMELPTGPVPRTGQFSEGEGVDEVEVSVNATKTKLVLTRFDAVSLRRVVSIVGALNWGGDWVATV